jgi:hypothetical protein
LVNFDRSPFLLLFQSNLFLPNVSLPTSALTPTFVSNLNNLARPCFFSFGKENLEGEGDDRMKFEPNKVLVSAQSHTTRYLANPEHHDPHNQTNTNAHASAHAQHELIATIASRAYA